MSVRDSVSKPFKKLKRRFKEGSRKLGEGFEREYDTEGGGTAQSSRLHLGAEDVAESIPGQKENDGEGKQTSSPSIDSRKPNRERAKFFPPSLS